MFHDTRTGRAALPILVIAAIIAMGLAAPAPPARATTPTADEVWSRGEYSVTPGGRSLSVTPTVSTTAPFPSGGVCVFDVLNVGSAEVQCRTSAATPIDPTTTSYTFCVPAGTSFRQKERIPINYLKLHSTTGTVAVRVRW